MDPFFGGAYESRHFEHSRWLTLDEMRGLIQSASYVPAPGAPSFEPMMAELDRSFAATENDGRVEVIYDTRMFFGQLR